MSTPRHRGTIIPLRWVGVVGLATVGGLIYLALSWVIAFRSEAHHLQNLIGEADLLLVGSLVCSIPWLALWTTGHFLGTRRGAFAGLAATTVTGLPVLLLKAPAFTFGHLALLMGLGLATSSLAGYLARFASPLPAEPASATPGTATEPEPAPSLGKAGLAGLALAWSLSGGLAVFEVAQAPLLIQGLKARPLRPRILSELRAEPARGARILAAALKLSDPEARDLAARALGAMGHDAHPAVHDLTALLTDRDKTVRRWAARILGGTRLVDPEATAGLIGALEAKPVIVSCLKHGDSRARTELTASIWALGAEAVQTVPILIEMMREPSENMREMAVYGLQCIGPDAKDAVPLLIESLERESNIRWNVFRALTRVDPEGQYSAPRLLRLFKHRNKEVRYYAMEAVGRMEVRTPQVVSALLQALEDKESSIRTSAALALGRTARPTKQVISALMELLRDKEPNVRLSSALALARFGPEAGPAVPALRKQLRDGSGRVRCWTASALISIDPTIKLAMETLIEELHSQDHCVRAEAAQALTRLGPDAAPAAPHLGKALKDDYREVREAALGEIGESASREPAEP